MNLLELQLTHMQIFVDLIIYLSFMGETLQAYALKLFCT